jgi:hypothetical protein
MNRAQFQPTREIAFHERPQNVGVRITFRPLNQTKAVVPEQEQTTTYQSDGDVAEQRTAQSMDTTRGTPRFKMFYTGMKA